VLASAARHAIPLNRLELELTERPVAEGAARQTDSLQMLRRRKAKLVIDDFGMGLSSLSHLQHWPVDIIKIDRSFIIDIEQDIRSLQLFEGMIDVGRALGAEMTAEGVETPGQVGLLRALRVERRRDSTFPRRCRPLRLAHFSSRTTDLSCLLQRN
jgi:EAL domain-containing protein (putative c-di-GMP-specific phosphodiesterase class I)